MRSISGFCEHISLFILSYFAPTIPLLDSDIRLLVAELTSGYVWISVFTEMTKSESHSHSHEGGNLGSVNISEEETKRVKSDSVRFDKEHTLSICIIT